MSTTASRTRVLAAQAPISFSGRWETTPSQGLLATWPASSFTFHFTGGFLAVEGGPNSARLTRPDGEEPMLVFCVTKPGELETAAHMRTVRNFRSGEIVVLYHNPAEGDEERVCTLYMADWGSVIEVAAFLCDSKDCLLPVPKEEEPNERLLVIGDSISCAFTIGAVYGIPPHNAWDGYPLLLGRLLKAEGRKIAVESVAYPGILLVDRRDGVWEDGMVSRFWQKSWWSQARWDPKRSPLYHPPTMIIIALGANDQGFGVSVPHFVDNMCKFVERLADTFSETLKEIVILGPFYSVSVGYSRYQDAMATLVQELRHAWEGDENKPRIHHIPIQGWLDDNLVPDGLHPSVEGNKVIAKKLFELEQNGWEEKIVELPDEVTP